MRLASGRWRVANFDRFDWLNAIAHVVFERGLGSDDLANYCPDCSSSYVDPCLCRFCSVYFDEGGVEFFQEWFMCLTYGREG